MTVPVTNTVFIATTKAHPFLMSFGKFFIISTMGELLGRRIVGGRWTQPSGLIYRMVIWGCHRDGRSGGRAPSLAPCRILKQRRKGCTAGGTPFLQLVSGGWIIYYADDALTLVRGRTED